MSSRIEQGPYPEGRFPEQGVEKSSVPQSKTHSPRISPSKFIGSARIPAAAGSVLHKINEPPKSAGGLAVVSGHPFPELSSKPLKSFDPNHLDEVKKHLATLHNTDEARDHFIQSLKASAKSDEEIIKFGLALRERPMICKFFLDSVSNKNLTRLLELARKFDKELIFAVAWIRTSETTPDELSELAEKEFKTGNKTLALSLANNLLQGIKSKPNADNEIKLRDLIFKGKIEELTNVESQNLKEVVTELFDAKYKDKTIEYLKNNPVDAAKAVKAIKTNNLSKSPIRQVEENLIESLKSMDDDLRKKYRGIQDIGTVLHKLEGQIKENPKNESLMKQKIVNEEKFAQLSKEITDLKHKFLELYGACCTIKGKDEKTLKIHINFKPNIKITEVEEYLNKTSIFTDNHRYSFTITKLKKSVDDLNLAKQTFTPQDEEFFQGQIRFIMSELSWIDKFFNNKRPVDSQQKLIEYHHSDVEACSIIDDQTHRDYINASAQVRDNLEKLQKVLSKGSKDEIQNALENLKESLEIKYDTMTKIGLNPSGIEEYKTLMNQTLEAASGSQASA